MRATRPAPRPRRTGRRRPVVAVTGAGGPVGQAVVAALAAHAGVRWVVAVEDVDSPVVDVAPRRDGVVHVRADVSSPQVAQVLTGVEVVIHLATMEDVVSGPGQEHRRGRAVRAAQAVTTAAGAIGATRLIAVTSAMVFGARADNPVPLPDDAPLRAEPDDGVVGDLLEVEQVLERAERVHPGLRLTVVRPAMLVGPGVDTALTRHFEAPRLLVLRSGGTRWQFCHVADLAAAVVHAVTTGTAGRLTVGAPGSLTEDQVECVSGLRRIEVPEALAFSTAERLHRVGVLPGPASELAYVVHPWVVSAAALTEAGWSAAHGNEECLRELLEALAGRRTTGRRDHRREAALGAAGAAVALVGTAAVLRQARTRQGRRGPRGGLADPPQDGP